jgi:hypothetical protein
LSVRYFYQQEHQDEWLYSQNPRVSQAGDEVVQLVDYAHRMRSHRHQLGTSHAVVTETFLRGLQDRDDQIVRMLPRVSDDRDIRIGVCICMASGGGWF